MANVIWRVLFWFFTVPVFKFIFFYYKILLVFYSYIVSSFRLIQHTDDSDRKRLVIIGGGFAGALAAKKLEDFFQVTLIDTKDYFEFTPSVLRTIVEPNHVSHIQIYHHDYLDLKKTLVLRQKGIQINKDNSVLLDNGQIVYFDYLFIACGSDYNAPFKEANVVMATRGNTLSRNYSQLCQSNKVLIIGGGIVGVELAAEIAEAFPDKQVVLVHAGPHLLSRSRAPLRAVNYCENWLKKHNVELIMGERVVEQQGRVFLTDQKRAINADMAFICTGIKSNSSLLKEHYSSALDADGFIHTNTYLQLHDHGTIFVAGDVASIKEEKLAQNAEDAAEVVVKNLLLHSRGYSSSHFHEYKPHPKPKLISLGKYSGVFVMESISFSGFVPALMKEFVEWKVMSEYRYRAGKIFSVGSL